MTLFLLHYEYICGILKKFDEKLLHKYEHKRPEVVFEWKDTETEAEGWVVINSLKEEQQVVELACVLA